MSRHSRRRAETVREVRRANRTRCAVCTLPWATRALVELAAENRDSLHYIARRFGLSRGQLARHLNRCGHRGET